MQALLVDAFPETERGRKAFRAYRGYIEKCFRPFSSLDVRPVQFHVRRVDQLGEFVYDAKQRSARPQEGLYRDPSAVTRFDHLDFVFVNVPGEVLPWATSNRPILLLLKMCRDTQKVAFVAGAAARMYAFVHCSGATDLRVVNGSGQQGGNRRSIAAAPTPVSTTSCKRGGALAGETEVCLDSDTGDIYAFDNASLSWRPSCSAGVHARTTSALRSRGANANGNLRRSPAHKEVSGILRHGRLGEMLCRARIENLHHWLFDGLSGPEPGRPQPRIEFLVRGSHKWCLDEVANDTLTTDKYITIADGDNGPLLCEHGNALLCNFEVGRLEYPEAQQLLKRFIEVKFRLMLEYEHLDSSCAPMLQPSFTEGQRKQARAQPNRTQGTHIVSTAAALAAASDTAIHAVSKVQGTRRGDAIRAFQTVATKRYASNGAGNSGSDKFAGRAQKLPNHTPLGLSAAYASVRGLATSGSQSGDSYRCSNAVKTWRRASPRSNDAVRANCSHHRPIRPLSAPPSRSPCRAQRNSASSGQRSFSLSTASTATVDLMRRHTKTGSGQGSGTPLSARSAFSVTTTAHIEATTAWLNSPTRKRRTQRPHSASRIVEQAGLDLERTLAAAQAATDTVSAVANNAKAMDGQEQKGVEESTTVSETDAADPATEMTSETQHSDNSSIYFVDEDDGDYSYDQSVDEEEDRDSEQEGHSARQFAAGRVVGGCWRPHRIGTTRVKRTSGRQKNACYCAHEKFKAMRRHDQAQVANGWYSIVNDGPYRSRYEQELHEYHEGKKKWMTESPFHSTFGKRTTGLKPATPINTGAGPWITPLTGPLAFRVEDKKKNVSSKAFSTHGRPLTYPRHLLAD